MVMSVPEQERRIAELDGLRATRGLTESEVCEADRLSMNQYMRAWRRQQLENLGCTYETYRRRRARRLQECAI